MNDLIIELDLKDDGYFTALRLAAGAVCMLAEKDADSAEDFKVCVSESALILRNNGFTRMKAYFNATSGVKAHIVGGNKCGNVNGDNELSLALIGALVDKCSFEEDEGVISSVTLEL